MKIDKDVPLSIIKVEKGIPIPFPSYYKYKAMKEMKIGESFTVSNWTEENTARRYGTRVFKYTFKSKLIKKGLIRVWRVKRVNGVLVNEE